MQILEEELYMSAVSIIAYAILSTITLKVYSKDKGKTLLFYFLAWLSMTVYLTVEMTGFLLLDPFVWKMSYVVLSVSFVFWMLFIDYAFSDGISWKRFSMGAAYCSILVFWAFMPGNNVLITAAMQDGQMVYTYTMPSEILYVILLDLYFVLYGSTFVYWNINTLKAVPVEKKREANAMLIAGVSMLVMCIFFFVIDIGKNLMLFDESNQDVKDMIDMISTISFILLLVGSIMATIVIYRFPRITHLLPYTVYRLIVMSKNGVPYVEYKWSPKEIETALLSGLFSAISTMSKSITDEIEMGHIREMVFDKAVFLVEARFSPVTFGIVASKSSTDLKNSIKDFSEEFVSFYYNTLYNKDGFPVEIRENPSDVFLEKDVVGLIKKNFANIPNYIVEGFSTEDLMEKISAVKIDD